ncbi:hypothetical protein Tcan_10719 [Toxocara canis]|uniref:Pepsin inhibitor-3-like repeated domain-containing protein n=1 Tax=Toxocara canis TaxID=6265 RepID=A0A0B2VMM0_TOXCA|nr:hypothetical protein Tcan_10719 [Toxocara canis]
MSQEKVTLTSHLDHTIAPMCIARVELNLVKIFLVASLVFASLAQAIEPVDSEETNIIEIDDFLELGCKVMGGKLYKGNKKVRDLSEEEKKEVDDYQKILEKYFDDAYEKLNGDFDPEKVMAEIPKGPKLCN